MDCLDGLQQLDVNNGYVLVTDPPYGINLNLKWLSDIHVAHGKQPNKSDDKIIDDDKPFDASHLFKFKRRLIFCFPYLFLQSLVVEIASTTLRVGYDIIRVIGFDKNVRY